MGTHLKTALLLCAAGTLAACHHIEATHNLCGGTVACAKDPCSPVDIISGRPVGSLPRTGPRSLHGPRAAPGSGALDAAAPAPARSAAVAAPGRDRHAARGSAGPAALRGAGPAGLHGARPAGLHGARPSS